MLAYPSLSVFFSRILYMTFSISGGYTLSRFTGTDVGIESRMGNCSRKLQFLRFRAAQEMKLKERRNLKNIFLMLAYPSLSVFFFSHFVLDL